MDQLCATYNVARATRRWPMVIFYHLLNVAGINSRVILNANNGMFQRRRKFLKELSLKLLEEHLIRRSKIQSLPIIVRCMLEKYREKTELHKIGPSETTKRRRCQPCYTECKKTLLTQNSCEKCKIMLCSKKHSKIVCKNCLADVQNDYLE